MFSFATENNMEAILWSAAKFARKFQGIFFLGGGVFSAQMYFQVLFFVICMSVFKTNQIFSLHIWFIFSFSCF